MASEFSHTHNSEKVGDFFFPGEIEVMRTYPTYFLCSLPIIFSGFLKNIFFLSSLLFIVFSSGDVFKIRKEGKYGRDANDRDWILLVFLSNIVMVKFFKGKCLPSFSKCGGFLKQILLTFLITLKVGLGE